MRESSWSTNNFDLIRLLAATQVAITHAANYLKVSNPALDFLEIFPGVPIFFFISGYLIYRSYANITGQYLRRFFVNRALRLYPGLFACVIITALSIQWSGYYETHAVIPRDFALWTFSTLVGFPHFNPDFLRAYGVGAANGSLWTIGVELQFYALTPLLYFGMRRYKTMVGVLVTLFLAVNLTNAAFNDRSTIALKMLYASCLPWFYLFIAGAYLSTRQDLVERICRLPLVVYLALYIVTYAIAQHLGLGTHNELNPVGVALLVGIVLKIAYTNPSLSKRVLRGNDISYGVYIYHMPMVNLMLFRQPEGGVRPMAISLACTVILAAASWIFVEKRALRLKTIALRRYG